MSSEARLLRIRFITTDPEMISDAIARIRLATRDLGWVAEVHPPSPKHKRGWLDRLLHSVLRFERRMFRWKDGRADARTPQVSESFGMPDAVAIFGCRHSDVEPSLRPEGALRIEVDWPGTGSPVWATLAAIVRRSDCLGFDWTAQPPAGPISRGSVRVATKRRASVTADAAVAKAVVMCIDLSRKFASGSDAVNWQALDDVLPPPNLKPSPILVLRYLTLLFWRELRAIARARVIGAQEWHVVLRRGSPWQASNESEVKVPNPPGRYLADPFLASTAEGDFLFVEDYSRHTRAGQISAFRVEPDAKIIDLGTVVREHVHLSFPFLFRIGDVWHMCPESSGYAEVRLYRCTHFPLEWHHVATPLTEVSAADPMIFEREGRWWLLVNIDSSGGRDHCTELHVYSSTDPLDGEWEAHPMNPVLADSRCARNAGLLFDGQRVFRAAQVQGFDCYGSSVILREIVTLTTSHYLERPASLPANLADVHLRHHISATDRWTASDQRNN